MRSLPPGIYTPLPTFFDNEEELDIESFRKHVTFIAQAGTVPVIAGSMGEACHLTNTERDMLVKTARQALDSSESTRDIPVVVGIGAPSTRETIHLAKAACAAGADFALLIAPGYYAGNLKGDDLLAVKQYMIDVSNASPIPTILYNFPALTGGIDIQSEHIIDIVKASPNVIGAKFTCADVGKISRVTSALEEVDFQRQYPRTIGGHAQVPYFSAIDGFIDFLLPSVTVGARGAISGLPNIAPRVCAKLWKLCERSIESPALMQEARRLQDLVNRADYVVKAVGVPGMKFLLAKTFGYGKLPRRPLLPYDTPSIERGQKLIHHPAVKEVLDLEHDLTQGT
jgi:4-hydroxy-2-oxoglutarate aldolase